MTPKEKAYELVDKYYSTFAKKLQLSESFNSSHRYKFCKPLAKECAFVAVDEMIKAIPDASDYDSPYNHELVYWQLVKEEIEKL